jgi:Flp pilus assembly protein TadD
VVALDSSDSRAHAALGYLLIHAGDRDAGIAEWRRALELKPDFPGLREQLQKMGQ